MVTKLQYIDHCTQHITPVNIVLTHGISYSALICSKKYAVSGSSCKNACRFKPCHVLIGHRAIGDAPCAIV